MKLYMYKGLPASGKSTDAKNRVVNSHNTVRINKDDLRAMIDCGKHSKRKERLIIKARDALIKLHLVAGNDVLVDDTNLNPFHEKDLRSIALDYGAEFKIIDFTGVSPEECIRRDSLRVNCVGSKVILDMYNRYLI